MGGVSRQGPPLYTQHEGAIWLATQVASRRVFAAGKLGTSELECICYYLSMRRGAAKFPYISDIKKRMSVNAGIFPATDEVLDDWANYMITNVLPSLDGIAEWNETYSLHESQVLNAFAPKAKRFPSSSLEPFYEESSSARWSIRIPDRTKVAVVSSFSASIDAQWKHQSEIWPSKPVWNANISLIPIKAHYSPYLSPDATWAPEIIDSGWRAATKSIVDQVLASGAKLAIIGAGALSLPIAVALKNRGVIAIHTGGSTQILFGIKGMRWTTHNVISGFFNSAWVEPAPEEIPSHKNAVEGGCYW
jgi:hypothetical protein